MEISIGIVPGPDAERLAILAEELGYERVWLYDSASLYEDIWVHLALIAERTSRIGLGTAVLVPNLRHVMTTASAIATVARMAPGRLAVAIGTGFTARLVMNKGALSWATTETYVRQLRGLLAGEVVDIAGEDAVIEAVRLDPRRGPATGVALPFGRGRRSARRPGTAGRRARPGRCGSR